MTVELLESPVVSIQKEELRSVSFTSEDVLEDSVKRRLRDIYLKKAERLGNGYKGKVKMTFKSKEGEYLSVTTTIWAASPDYISLKGGLHIPTKAIADIQF